MNFDKFVVWPGEEKVLNVLIQDEEFKFNDWLDRHVLQGFSWRPGSISFATLDDGREGFLSVEVLVLESFVLGSDAVLAIRVPFEVPQGQTVYVGALIDDEEHRFEIPAGSYALHYETGFLRPPAGEDEDEDEDEEEDLDNQPTLWCRLTFVPQQDVEASILRASEDIDPGPTLLMEAQAVFNPYNP